MVASDAVATPPGPRYRQLQGPARVVQAVVLVAIPVLGLTFISGVHVDLGLIIFTEQWIGLFLALCLVALFISLPPRRNGPAQHRVPWYDAVLAAVSALPGLYLMVFYPAMVATLGGVHEARAIVSGLLVVLLVEATRRTVGWTLVIVVVVFLLYGRYGASIPGPLAAQSTDWVRLLNYLYVDPAGVTGLVRLAATIALAFIVFGQLLLVFGMANSLTDVAQLALGRLRGGSAKTAMLGSSLLGTLTGAPMTNVLLTGQITIPNMIRAGYSPATAGGIEATVSTGGQIMPPVMGIAAFLIAENLGLPYAQVALAALLPALLFYLGVYVQIDMEAGKRGLAGMPRAELPRARDVAKKAWVLLPILGTLLYTLFFLRMPPTLAAAVSAALSFPLVLLISENRHGIVQRVFRMFEGSAKLLLDVTIVLAAASVVVGVASISGLGFRVGYAVTQVSAAGGGVFVALLIAALASVFLGMGMPSVPAYALVAVLVAPALEEFGIAPLAAHLFIYYFAIVANITPPIGFAAFAAAPISGASPIRTCYEAMRVGVLIYIVPFLFVFHPELLLQGGADQVTVKLAIAVLAVIALGCAIVGYLARPLGVVSRLLLLASTVLLLSPMPTAELLNSARIAGTVLALAIGLREIVVARREPPELTADDAGLPSGSPAYHNVASERAE